jgi:hypothetical protein
MIASNAVVPTSAFARRRCCLEISVIVDMSQERFLDLAYLLFSWVLRELKRIWDDVGIFPRWRN